MTILLLAGSGEARKIAWGLADYRGRAVASLAGVTRSPDPLPLPTRIGGFGGDAGFEAYLGQEKITAVIDATHPFAQQITDRTARICGEKNIPYLHVLRPEWEPQEGDDWHMVAREEDVAGLVKMGATVFLGTGSQTLKRYAGLEGCRVLCRQIDPPTAPFPFEGGEFIIGRPPFSKAAEITLFKALGVDWLVVKNSGGTPSRSKLDAARALKIPVAMIRRAPQPEAARVQSAEAALGWVAGL